MSVRQDDDGILLTAQHGIEQAALKFGVDGCKPVLTPFPPGAVVDANDCPDEGEHRADKPRREVAGLFQWWPTTRRGPGMGHAASQLARVAHNPAPKHWKLAMRALRHMVSTKTKGIWYPKCNQGQSLERGWVDAFCDSSWAGIPGRIGEGLGKSRDASRSTSGHVIRCGGAPVAWGSSAQKLITLSSTEAELVETVSAPKTIKCVRSSMMELIGLAEMEPATLFEGNQPVLHILDEEPKGVKKRTKHISARWLAAREWILAGEIRMREVSALDNLADIMTKSLPTAACSHLRNGMIGGVDDPIPQLKFDRNAELGTWRARSKAEAGVKRRRLE